MGTLLGQKLIVTEFIAYVEMTKLTAADALSARSELIATYALCGFAHLASLAIFVGGFCALAPAKTHAVASVAARALLAATLACLLTACVAGTFFTNTSILFSG